MKLPLLSTTFCLFELTANPWISMVTTKKKTSQTCILLDLLSIKLHSDHIYTTCERVWITYLGGPKSKQNLQGTLQPSRFSNFSLEFSLCSVARGNQHPPVHQGGCMVHDQQTVFCWAPIPYLAMVISSVAFFHYLTINNLVDK